MLKESEFSIQGMLASSVTGGFILILLVWMFFPPAGDPGSLAVLNTLTGSFATAFGVVVSFYFGSTKGSNEKDRTISTMAATASAAPAPAAPAVGTTTSTTTAQTTTPTPEKAPSPWWNLLTDAERQAIFAAAPTDTKVQDFISRAHAGAATVDDLTYLVGVGLLTEDRSKAIQAEHPKGPNDGPAKG